MDKLLFSLFLIAGSVLLVGCDQLSKAPNENNSANPTLSNLPSSLQEMQNKTQAANQIQGSDTQTKSENTNPATVSGLFFTIELEHEGSPSGTLKGILFPQLAPKTVANFQSKVQSGFYNGLTFHRVEDWVVQGGDPKGNGTGGQTMPTELNNQPFNVGALGVARGSDIKISNDSQFFITKKDAFWLQGQYTNFGQLTEGGDALTKIAIGDRIKRIIIQNQ